MILKKHKYIIPLLEFSLFCYQHHKTEGISAKNLQTQNRNLFSGNYQCFDLQKKIRYLYSNTAENVELLT